jgi:hypothetical protein
MKKQDTHSVELRGLREMLDIVLKDNALLRSQLDFESKTHAKTLELLDTAEKKIVELSSDIDDLNEELDGWYSDYPPGR